MAQSARVFLNSSKKNKKNETEVKESLDDENASGESLNGSNAKSASTESLDIHSVVSDSSSSAVSEADLLEDLYLRYIDGNKQEDMRHYDVDGYYPLQVFDLFRDRYSIILKLGWGRFSTVWLAWDLRMRMFVAIKVMKAGKKHDEMAENEIKLLRKAKQHSSGRASVVKLFQTFQVRSINGRHTCLVLELLGQSLYDLLHESETGIPLENVKSITQQMLKGLNALHSAGVIHTDLKPENVLLTFDQAEATKLAFKVFYRMHKQLQLPSKFIANAPDWQFMEQEKLTKLQFKRKNRSRVRNNLGRKHQVPDLPKDTVLAFPTLTSMYFRIAYYEDVGYPAYVVDILKSASTWIEEEINKKKTSSGPAFEPCEVKVKIADLGNACIAKQPFTDEIQTRQYRAPEVVLSAGYNTTVDIWSVACIAFEMATGDYLFDVLHNSDNRDADHLASMILTLGPIPADFVLNSRRCGEFFDSDGKFLFDTDREMNLFQLLTEIYEFKEKEARKLSKFLQKLLVYDPKKRPDARACLQSSFFEGLGGGAKKSKKPVGEKSGKDEVVSDQVPSSTTAIIDAAGAPTDDLSAVSTV